jgi:pyridoxal phosphate enzyme (YggS family)
MVDTAEASAALRERLADVRRRIADCAAGCQRSPDEITLVAVSKTHPAEVVRAAIVAGVTDLGENRVQEAEAKILQVGRNAARWHLIGHLQSNKARKAVALFDFVHSIDSPALAQKLDRFCIEDDRKLLTILIQVDLAQEKTKSGVGENELPALLKTIDECERLQLAGLMTLPPYFENADCARPFFKALRDLRDQMKLEGRFGEGRGELSMGMSHDFEIAIEEGATILRVGTAIFGERS